MGVCVFCGTPDKLNTSMTITLDDGNKADVLICDEHAEDATVKTTKIAYQDKQKQIDAVLAQAKTLGLDISQASPGGKLFIAQQQSASGQQPTTQSTVRQPVVQAIRDPTIVSAPLLENDEDGIVVPVERLRREITSVGGNVQLQGISASVPSYRSHDLNAPLKDRNGNELNESLRRGSAKLTAVEGRAGHPLVIPTVVRDGTGTTVIKVAKIMDGHKMDRRFKDMADASRYDQGHDFRNSYEASSEHICPICRGECSTMHRGNRIVCPKCGGVGTVT